MTTRSDRNEREQTLARLSGRRAAVVVAAPRRVTGEEFAPQGLTVVDDGDATG